MLQGHVATCGFALVPCPKRCDKAQFMRKDLDKHLENCCPNRDTSASLNVERRARMPTLLAHPGHMMKLANEDTSLLDVIQK